MSDDHTNETPSTEEHGSSDEHVRSLGEDRYVVSLDDGDDSPPAADRTDEPAPEGDPRRRLAALDGAYALELHARHGTGTDSLRVETNDVAEAFESLLRWYAGSVAADTPAETVVSTLLANSGLDIDGARVDAGSSRS